MNIQPDKKLHLIVGAVIAIIATAVAGNFAAPTILLTYLGSLYPLVVGNCVATAVGLAKEFIYDKLVPGHEVSWADAAYTSAGGLIGSLVITGLQWIT